MIKHFHQRIDDIDNEINFILKLEMNNENRQKLRENLNELIGIKRFGDVKFNKSKQYSK